MEKAIGVEPRPGTVVDNGKPTAHKVPWKFSDMEKMYPSVTFTPEETIPITVHGLKYQLIADQPISVPSIVKDIYDDHRKAGRSSPKVFVSSAGDVVGITPGAGPLEPERFVEKT